MISREEAKDILVQYCMHGIKNTDIVVELSMYCAAFPDLAKMDIPDLLEELVKENKLIEIEYILPQVDYRIKSFFLPVGTEIQSIRGPIKLAGMLLE
jgi:hypothetical protein